MANADFFLKTLPLFDAGDDVGMVLSPQSFYNVDTNQDIFNHGNIQFWEYAQHGYDAFGFISCTGAPLCAYYYVPGAQTLAAEFSTEPWFAGAANSIVCRGDAMQRVVLSQIKSDTPTDAWLCHCRYQFPDPVQRL